MNKKLLRKLTIVVTIIAVIATLIVSNRYNNSAAFAATNGIKVHFYKPADWGQANY